MSVMRLYYAIRMQETRDVTYESGPMGLWTLAEFATTIICGCMPTLPKFCQTIGPKLYSSSRNGMSLKLIWKSSKLSPTFAKQSIIASSPRPASDTRAIKPQPQGRYTSLEELELGSPSNHGSTMSRTSENLSGLLPSFSDRVTSSQRQVEEDKLEERRSQNSHAVGSATRSCGGGVDVESQGFKGSKMSRW